MCKQKSSSNRNSVSAQGYQWYPVLKFNKSSVVKIIQYFEIKSLFTIPETMYVNNKIIRNRPMIPCIKSRCQATFNLSDLAFCNQTNASVWVLLNDNIELSLKNYFKWYYW